MIARSAPSRASALATKGLAVAAVAWASLLALGLLLKLDWLAAGLCGAIALVGLTFWRPRIGFCLAVFLTVALEPQADDPIMHFGWLFQSDVSSWTPIRFINFSPLELLLLLVALAVLSQAVIERKQLLGTQMGWPLLIFLCLLVVSVVWGLANGGDFKVSLWETRSLFLAGLVAFLVPNVLYRREQLEHLLDLACLAIVLLSLEIIWRRFFLLGNVTFLDLEFAHETPVWMNLVVILLLARLIWRSSGRKRLAALAIPLILYAEMLTERRAGWISLDVGLILLAILAFRFQQRAFYWFVLPVLALYAVYLGIYWNGDQTSALAQPARAVHSIFAPDPRDASSNVYRVMETVNVRQNIHDHPITGLGFGHQFTFYYSLPDLSANWPFYRYTTHNAFLWIWMKMGTLGFIVFLTLLGAGVVRGVQLLRRTAAGRSAPLLVAVVSALLMVLVYTYVDVSLTIARLTILLGLALGVIGAWGRNASMYEGGE